MNIYKGLRALLQQNQSNQKEDTTTETPQPLPTNVDYRGLIFSADSLTAFIKKNFSNPNEVTSHDVAQYTQARIRHYYYIINILSEKSTLFGQILF